MPQTGAAAARSARTRNDSSWRQRPDQATLLGRGDAGAKDVRVLPVALDGRELSAGVQQCYKSGPAATRQSGSSR